jgi:hypothetical protein
MKGGVPDVECKVGRGSDDGDEGVRNEIGGRKSRPRITYPPEQPINAEHHRKTGRYRVWNEIEALLIEVEERPFTWRSANRNAVWKAE